MMKKSLLLSLTGLGLLAGAATFAQINVKSDLSNAIQNIQRVYFSPEGIKHSDPSKNILVEISNGVIKVQGKVIMEEGQATNTLAPQSQGSLVLQGKNNQLSGTQAISVGGENNIIAQSSEKGMILGGDTNRIEGSSQQGVLLAGLENKIKN